MRQERKELDPEWEIFHPRIFKDDAAGLLSLFFSKFLKITSMMKAEARRMLSGSAPGLLSRNDAM